MSAKRPVLYAGGGAIQGNAVALLTKLTKKLGYPCTNSLMGLGAYPGTDKLFLGMLGMVKQWQDMQYVGRYSHSTYAESLPGFVKLAEAYGHVGIKIEKLSELKKKMKEAFALKDKSVFIDVMVDPDEHVYPMAIKGGAMKDMYLSKTERT